MKGEVIRNNSKTILSEIINDENITNNLEKGVFNFSIWKAKERHEPCTWENNNFINIYKNKLKQICANIMPGCYVQNKQMLQKLKNGDYKPHEIAFLPPNKLFPERWEKIVQEKEKRDAVISEIDYGQATNQFTCARCKGNKTTYYTMQTRSADEAETIFITCLECGRRWRK